MNVQHEALKKFSYQIEFALNNYSAHGMDITKYTNIMIGGLGGSGIGGRLVKNIFMDEFPVPVECIADYTLPSYVNKSTLVILGSYSGNTEETLFMFDEVKKRGCDMIILTGGGKLAEHATENNLKRYHLEPGFQPRMALGFSLTYLVQIFAEFIKKDVASTLKEIAAKVKDTAPYEEEMTRAFEAIKSKVNNKFIIVTDGYFESTGIRFAQQIQENAKHEAFVSVLPEANHNMIESYYGDLPSLYILLNSNSNPRVGARFEFITNLLEVENHKVINMAVNKFNLEAVYEMIHRLDWLSLYVADYRKVDSLNVPNIASLKEYLSNV
jgi:glucose/mannose-6-phosphate isomerase